MPNKPCRFLVCDELKIQTDERKNFVIDSPVLSLIVSFVFTSKAVQKTVSCIEGQETSSLCGVCVCVCVCVCYVEYIHRHG